MNKSPRWTQARSGIRPDAELMSTGPQRHRTLTRRARPPTAWVLPATCAILFANGIPPGSSRNGYAVPAGSPSVEETKARTR
jgi:hypothetical protein